MAGTGARLVSRTTPSLLQPSEAWLVGVQRTKVRRREKALLARPGGQQVAGWPCGGTLSEPLHL